MIDSHVTAPAVGATEPGTFVGALGTSAAYLLLDDARRPLPSGIEGVARDGVIPGLWCYEAGQPAFGDVLGWFVREFVGSESVDQSFTRFEAQLADRPPGESDLVALDWWNGSRAPLSDSTVSGLLLGLTLKTTPMDVYCALVESLCFGARSIAERLIAGSAPITRVILASGVAEKSPFAMQTMADILGRMVEVPRIRHAAAVGAAIHGAVAAGVAPDFRTGARRYGASDFVLYRPRGSHARSYEPTLQRLFATGQRSPNSRRHASHPEMTAGETPVCWGWSQCLNLDRCLSIGFRCLRPSQERRAGFAEHQRGRKDDDMPPAGVVAADAVHEEANRLVDHGSDRMFRAGEIRPQAPYAGNVVGRGDRKVFGATESQIRDGPHHAKRHDAVGDVGAVGRTDCCRSSRAAE